MPFAKTKYDENGEKIVDPNINRNGQNRGSGKNLLFDALLDLDPNITRADVVKRCWEIMNDNEVEPKVQLSAAQKLIDYTFNKPTVSVELNQDIELDD